MKYEDYLQIDTKELMDLLKESFEDGLYETNKQLKEGNIAAGRRARKHLGKAMAMIRALRKHVSTRNNEIRNK